MNDVLAAELADRPPQPQPLRLRIWHLMVWMAATGVMMVIYDPQNIERQAKANNYELTVQWYLYMIVGAMSGGMCVSSLILAWVERRKSNAQFPIHPGHWFLISAGLSTIASFLAFRLFVTFTTKESDWLYDYGTRSAGLTAGLAVALIMTFYILARMRERHWFLVVLICFPFELLRAANGLLIVTTSLFDDDYVGYYAVWTEIWLDTVYTLIAICGMFISTTIDLRQRISRDSLHYVALAMFLLIDVLKIAVVWNWL